ncbi:MAG: cysteine hydrolase [Chloroflexi bacterium]|nr:cysteine hydrolase [Chloroflexota bacterium]
MRTVGQIKVYETLEEIVNPQHTALMVIDVQNDNASPRGAIAAAGRDISWIRDGALPVIKKVLAEARRLGITVIFCRNTKSADGTMESGPKFRFRSKGSNSKGLASYEVEGTWGHEVLDELEPRPNERQIVKFRSSAFIGTPLDMLLKGNGIESVVVVGLVTQGCVLATVSDLMHYGYYGVVLSDGVASGNPEAHKAGLIVMQHKGDVVTSGEVLKTWQNR